MTHGLTVVFSLDIWEKRITFFLGLTKTNCIISVLAGLACENRSGAVEKSESVCTVWETENLEHCC
jgi:hypothetical protein